MEELCCLADLPGLRVSDDEANGWLYNPWLGVPNEASIKAPRSQHWYVPDGAAPPQNTK
jgi:hypothetical protein